MQQGMATGYKDENNNYTGEYKPGNNVTYAEIIKIALEAADHTATSTIPQNRSARNTWAAGYIATAENLNTAVLTASTNVHTPATRGEVMAIIGSILNVNTANSAVDTYTDVPMTHAFANPIGHFTTLQCVQGDSNVDGSLTGTFRPDGLINRAEVAQIMMKIHLALGL